VTPSERRLHPLSILFGFADGVRRFALPSLFFLATAGFAGFAWQLLMLPLAVPYLFASTARYLSFRYRYDPGELVIRSGFLFRNERHIPYARIQNIDGRQNVAHRLLGVMEVRVETGGGQEAEATMSVLPVADFEEMRRRVFGRNDADAESRETPAERTLLHLSPRELMIHGFIQNRGFIVITAGLGLLWELGPLDDFLGFVFDGKVPTRSAVRGLFSSFFDPGWLPQGIGLTMAALLALLVVVRLISMVWAVVRLHEFRLTRAGEDLRMEHGLLTRVVATVPLRRIQALTVLEGPLHRRFRRAAMKVDTAGGQASPAVEDSGESRARREWLAPILRREELPGLVREVLPGLDLEAVDWRPAPPRAFKRELKNWVLVSLIPMVPLTFFLRGWALAALPFLLGLAYAGARGTIRHLAWAVTEDAVLFRSGWLWRRVSVVPFAKIQAAAVHESPFDRRASMVRVRVDSAGAGEWSHRVDIPYLPRDTARELFALLEARAASTELRW
jgi:putative membrane protein